MGNIALGFTTTLLGCALLYGGFATADSVLLGLGIVLVAFGSAFLLKLQCDEADYDRD